MIFIIGKYAYVLNKVIFGQGSASVKFDSIATARLYRGNFMLHWTYSNNKPIFNMTCKATGYCAVAFTEPATGRNMEMYDIAAGFFVGSITTQQ